VGDSEPVLTAAVKAFVASVIAIAVALGVPIDDELRSALLALIGTGGTLLGILLAWRARARVTPLADPRDDDGRRLSRR